MAKTFTINKYNNAEGNPSKGTRLHVIDGETTTEIGIAGKALYNSDLRDTLVSIIESNTSSTLTEDEKTSLNTTITSYTFDADLE